MKKPLLLSSWFWKHYGSVVSNLLLCCWMFITPGLAQSWKVLEFYGKSLKSPWIPIFLEKSLKSPYFCTSPWKVLEFSSPLNLVAWEVFFDAVWLSKTEYKSQFREFKVMFNKRAGVRFFDKKHGLTPLENFEFLSF